MQKFITYIILFVILGCGLLSLYRFFFKENDFIKIGAKIITKKIEVVSVIKGRNRYGLIFSIDSYKDKLGIYLGTKDKLLNNQTLSLIDTNKIYTFLIDPTVLSDNGINLGVREITLSGQKIYKESQKFTFFIGIFFTLLSTIGLFIIQKYNKSTSS